MSTTPEIQNAHNNTTQHCSLLQFIAFSISQFTNVLSENFLRIFIVSAVAAGIFEIEAQTASTVGWILALALTIPWFFLSHHVGNLADARNKISLSIVVKLLEVPIILLAIVGIQQHSFMLLVVSFILLAIRGTILSPIKYSLLAQMVPTQHLLTANAITCALTFIALLAGAIAGSALATSLAGISEFMTTVFILTTLVIVLGIGSLLFIPKKLATALNPADFIRPSRRLVESGHTISEDADQNVKCNSMGSLLLFIRSDPTRFCFATTLGVFWCVAGVFLHQVSFTSVSIMQAGYELSLLIIGIIAAAIICGSIIITYLSRNLDLVQNPSNALHYNGEITIATCLLLFILVVFPLPDASAYQGISDLFSSPHLLLFVLLIFACATCATIMAIPLQTYLQQISARTHRSKVMAGVNLITAIAILVISPIIWLLQTILGDYLAFKLIMFLLIPLLGLCIIMYIFFAAQSRGLRFLRAFITFFFKPEIQGMENLQTSEQKIIVCNHTSLWDGIIFGALTHENFFYVISSLYFKLWWATPIISTPFTYPANPSNPYSLKSLIRMARENKKSIFICPEGRTSDKAELMPLYYGPVWLVSNLDNPKVVVMAIDGSHRSTLSKFKEFGKTKRFPKLRITFSKPVSMPDFAAQAKQKQMTKHDASTKWVRERQLSWMSEQIRATMYDNTCTDQNLFAGLLRYTHLEDLKKPVAGIAWDKQTLSAKRMFQGAFALQRNLQEIASSGAMASRLGLMLPTHYAFIVVNLGLQLSKICPVVINYTSGANNIINACALAGIDRIVSSKAFIEKAGFENLCEQIQGAGIEIHYLEDIREKLTTADKINAVLGSKYPMAMYKKSLAAKTKRDDPAYILFTSGSEDKPKAVVLSHGNLLANLHQVMVSMMLTPKDRVLNSLPLFHSFGLFASWLALYRNCFALYHPSPLDFKEIPEIIYHNSISVFFSTNSFLAQYQKHSLIHQLAPLRIVVAGAEALSPQVHDYWLNNFSINILQGYGVTEASPVVSFNTPIRFKTGTVGKLLPKIEYKLEPVEGITQGGKLLIKGPNAMLGYLATDDPEKINLLPDNWYDTGDVVEVDEDKFITILGRVKRFAKIAGEMVSLGYVEQQINKAFSDAAHCVLSCKHPQRGEQLVLLTTQSDLDTNKLSELWLLQNINNLSRPKTIFQLEQIPLLGNGKIDYPAAQKIAEEKLTDA